MPDGKTVTISAKFSEAEAARIDADRGKVTRSAWLRRQALGESASASAAPDGAAPDCSHPAKSVIKGRCTRCQTFVGF